MKLRITTVLLIAALTSTIMARTQTNPQWDKLRDEALPYRESLISFAVEFDDTRWYAQSRIVPDRPEDMKKALADLAAIEKLMTGPYAGMPAPKTSSIREIWEHPECWLEIAQARKTIAAKMVKRILGDKASAEVKFIEGLTQAISTHDGWGLTETGLKIVMGKRAEVRDQITGGLAKVLESAGAPVDGDLIPGWNEACDKLVQEAKRLATSVRSYANHSDETITARIKAGWSKNYKDRTILKVATAKSEWTIVKNSLGVPRYRSKGVAVQYKVPGFAYVIEQTLSITEDYSGGKYTYRPTAQLSDYRILAGK